MNKIVSYDGKCKACGWIFASNKIPQIPGMPANCEKCKGDMAVLPCWEDDSKGRNYEITIFCKETGVEIKNGASISSTDFEKWKSTGQIEKVANSIVESFATMLSDKKRIMQLIGENK